MSTTHTFNLGNTINAATGEPFGKKCDGTFTIRRPSLLDKNNIALRSAVMMSTFGSVDPNMLPDTTKLTIYAFSYVEVLAEGEVPEWFDRAKMYDESDENAVIAVWGEVAAFLASFRPKADGKTGESGGQQPSLLVQDQV